MRRFDFNEDLVGVGVDEMMNRTGVGVEYRGSARRAGDGGDGGAWLVES